MKNQKIRLSEEFIQKICYWGYDHGEPVDNIQVYTTLSCCHLEPVVKIITLSDRPGLNGVRYRATHFTVRCPKHIMFKGFTLEEFYKRFYAIRNPHTGKITFKFYK